MSAGITQSQCCLAFSGKIGIHPRLCIARYLSGPVRRPATTNNQWNSGLRRNVHLTLGPPQPYCASRICSQCSSDSGVPDFAYSPGLTTIYVRSTIHTQFHRFIPLTNLAFIDIHKHVYTDAYNAILSAWRHACTYAPKYRTRSKLIATRLMTHTFASHWQMDP